MGVVPPARGSTPAPRPQLNGYRYTQWLPLYSMATAILNGYRYTQWLPLYSGFSLYQASLRGRAINAVIG
jgi:hypothetical protein